LLVQGGVLCSLVLYLFVYWRELSETKPDNRKSIVIADELQIHNW
jgi:hypothetical protein